VTVQDHGIGIPRNEREHLFERFFRAENAKGRVSGMGLGLYISREIIQRHGGVMWVDSEEDQGSLFGIALPMVAATDEESPADEIEPALGEEAPAPPAGA
jgi:signal transduction histidine kinase